jgi:hypothetical protein
LIFGLAKTNTFQKMLFQMSAADSASLIDSGKAGNLGINRALYF